MKKFLPYLTILFLMFGFSFVHGQATINVTAGAADNTVNGNCSIYEAIEAANTNAMVDACTAGQAGGTDDIVIPDGTYDLSTVGTQLDISSSMILNGTSEAGTIIQANASAGVATFRVMEIDAVDVDVTVEDLTVRHGRVSGRGSGIFIEPSSNSTSGTIAFTRVTSTANQGIGASDSGPGLAVDNSPTSNTVTITDCTFSNNSGFNGGVHNAGASNFSMTNSIVSGNTTEGAGGESSATALAAGTNTITGCSIINNTSPGTADGSGVTVFNTATATFTNCTISGNTGSGNGPGISIATTGCSIINCTIVNNTSSGGSGGGLENQAAVTITNTIIANNSANSGGNDVESSGTITQTTSLVEDCNGTCPTWSYTSDPNLAAAGTCGSPAQTHFVPQHPSDALNTGTAPGGSIPATDICGTGVTDVKEIGSREADGVFPVELINFQVQNSERQSYLTWHTASEINNEGFEIEWSIDNRYWENIGFVAGAGDSFEKQFYEFKHSRPVSGINYYRLKQMDFDGGFEYSNTVSVDVPNFKNLENLKLFPNPTETGTFTVALPTSDFESAELNLFDLTGQLIHSQLLNNSQTEIRIFNLPKGIYTATVNLDGRQLFERVTVQ